jgi:hypothetical protein
VEKLPHVVDAVGVIGMFMGPDDGVHGGDIRLVHLVPEIWRRVYQDVVVAGADQDGDAAAAVAGFGRVAAAPIIADARYARRRSAPQDPDLH